MLKLTDKILIIIGMVLMIGGATPALAVLSCSVTASSSCTGIVVLRMSAATNAHAEMPSQSTSNYANNVICCTGLSGTSCSGRYASVLRLSSTTNAHVELATNANYANVACMSSATEIPLIGYQDTNCTGFDTTLVSISSTTNATIGNSSNYTKKVCGSLTPPTITFSISTSTVYLGIVSPVQTRYGSSTNSGGSGSEVEAHTITVNTSAVNGYTVTAKGATLTAGTSTIAAIGAVNSAPQVGVEQFGIRLTASGGIGTSTSPYIGTGFAFGATATSASQIANASTGDSATTTFSVRYVANIAPTTQPGAYTTSIVYVATANF